MAAANSKRWWAERGVAKEVRDARPYVRWTTRDLEPVREGFSGLTGGQLKTLLGWARQSDGLVIHRHSFERVPPHDPRRVYPEIRPDQAVKIDTSWHYHGPRKKERPTHPTSGRPLRPEQIHTPGSMAKHIARARDDDDHRGTNSSEVHSHSQVAKYLFPPSANGQGLWVHSHQEEYEKRVLRELGTAEESTGGDDARDGADTMATHGATCFRSVPVPIFKSTLLTAPSLPVPRHLSDAEATDASGADRRRTEFLAWLERHAAKEHYNKKKGVYETQLPNGEQKFTFATPHLHPTRCKLRDEQLAKRIDVNPLVWERGGFEGAKRVFFAIEGCIKADAILSALLHEGEPPAVFSVPSVSLWEATYPAPNETEVDEGNELAAFVRTHLRGKLICIVPDADGHTKDEVMTQALLCRSTLRRLGVRAEVVLPPDERLEQGIKGVDDYLGKGGGSLDGLIWYQKEPPPQEALIAWLKHQPTTQAWKRDRLQRAVDALQSLATHAGENGEYSASLRLLARANARRRERPSRLSQNGGAHATDSARTLDAARKRLERGYKDLVDSGAITSNKPLSIRQEKWLRKQSGWYLTRGLHWSEDDVVIAIHEQLRAPAERRSVRDLSSTIEGLQLADTATG